MTEKMVRLKAAVRQIYGGRSLKPGDPYPDPVPERVARGLIANHYADVDTDYQTQVMMASEPLVTHRRGRYKRRDIRSAK